MAERLITGERVQVHQVVSCLVRRFGRDTYRVVNIVRSSGGPTKTLSLEKVCAPRTGGSDVA